MKDLFEVGICGILLLIAFMFLAPFLNFAVAYVCGWFAKIIIGDQLIRSFEFLGILITKDQIPLFAGCLGWIGGFFKESYYQRAKKES